MFVEELSRVPNNWNKGQSAHGTMREVVAKADDADELLRLGIVALADRRRAAGATRLLEVKRGALGSFSSWFSKRCRNCRVAEGICDAWQDFHSLRKDFYQGLRAGQVDYPIRVRLMGHALKDVSETNYGPTHESLHDLKRCIDTIPADTLGIRTRL